MTNQSGRRPIADERFQETDYGYAQTMIVPAPLTYAEADYTTTDGADGYALVAKATYLLIINQEATSTNFARIAFGADEATAEANLAHSATKATKGECIFPLGGSKHLIKIPGPLVGSGYYALETGVTGSTQVLYVSQRS